MEPLPATQRLTRVIAFLESIIQRLRVIIHDDPCPGLKNLEMDLTYVRDSLVSIRDLLASFPGVHLL